jgi:hypothetical protein
LVTGLVEDALSARERLDLELHMVVCEGCGAVARQMRVTVAVLRGLPPEAAPDELVAAVLARLPSGRGAVTE